MTDTASTIVLLSDETAPSITAPGNTTRVSNTVVGYVGSIGAATASDNCTSAPAITNDAPPVLPVGDTTVVWTATDDSYNPASATQVVTVLNATTLGAKDVMAEAKDVLEDLVGSDKHSSKDLDKAIKHLDMAMEDDSWINGDPPRLEEKKGKRVFDEGKGAIKSLMKIIKGKGKTSDPAIADDVLDVILRLVEADRLLAETALDDARAALDALEPGDKKAKKVAKEIASAEKELAKAQQDLDKGKFDKAIDGFKKAWEHAQQAIKAAKPKGKGK